MSLQTQLELLASTIGTDVKGIRNTVGVLANLTTSDKTDIVNAINEIKLITDVSDTKIGGDLEAIAAAVGITGVGALGERDIVQALTELNTKGNANLATTNALIDDSASAGNTGNAYSADKIISLIATSQASILGGLAPEALDTITELAAFLTDNAVVDGLISQLANRVRVDAVQTFTGTKQQVARDNISAAAAADLTLLTSNVGDTTTDFVATYSAALV